MAPEVGMTETTRGPAKRILPDYEATLRQNARRVLLRHGRRLRSNRCGMGAAAPATAPLRPS